MQSFTDGKRELIFQGETNCLKLIDAENDCILKSYTCHGKVIHLSLSEDKRHAYFISKRDSKRSNMPQYLFSVEIPLEVLLGQNINEDDQGKSLSLSDFNE